MTKTEHHQLEPRLIGNHLTSQSGLPLIRKPQEKRTCGAIICFLHPLSVWWREGGGGGGSREADAVVSSFFHSLLPGAVQFLDSSLSASSRLLLSDFCSNLLPPCLLWSLSPRLDTSRSGTRLSRHNHGKRSAKPQFNSL